MQKKPRKKKLLSEKQKEVLAKNNFRNIGSDLATKIRRKGQKKQVENMNFCRDFHKLLNFEMFEAIYDDPETQEKINGLVLIFRALLKQAASGNVTAITTILKALGYMAENSTITIKDDAITKDKLIHLQKILTNE